MGDITDSGGYSSCEIDEPERDKTDDVCDDEDSNAQTTEGLGDIDAEEDMYLHDDDDNPENAFGGSSNGGVSNTGPYGNGLFGPRPVHRPVSMETRTRRAKVIHEILAKFDLETVMDRYRGNSANVSYARSLQSRRYHHAIPAIMGSKNPPSSDRSWNLKFQQRIIEDFDRRQDEQERRLADAEVKRVMRLKLQGCLTPNSNKEEEERDEVDGVGTRGSKRRGRSKMDQKWQERSTKHQDLYIRPNDDLETQMEILHRVEREDTKRQNRENGNDESGEKGDGRQKEDDNEEKEKDEEEKRIQAQQNTHQNEGMQNSDFDISNETTSQEDGNNLSGLKSLAGRDRLNPELVRLYEEEDLRGLYREAELLLRKNFQ